MNTWKKAVVSTAAMAAMVGSGGPALADDGTVTGGDVSGAASSATPAEKRQSDAKLSFADAYYAAKYEGGSAAALRAAAAAYDTAYPAAADKSIERLATAAGSRALVRRAARSSAAWYDSKKLPLVHRGQLNSYFCGPASGRMMLDLLGAGASKFTGDPKHQNNIGDKDHMRTAVNEKTGWDSGLFRIGLNKWRQGRARGYYIQVDSPSVARFKESLVTNIDRDYPLAADTVETPADRPYNGHPRAREARGHWIVAYGYDDRGEVVRFADPATTVWPNTTNATFSAPISRFVPDYLQENGIAW